MAAHRASMRASNTRSGITSSLVRALCWRASSKSRSGPSLVKSDRKKEWRSTAGVQADMDCRQSHCSSSHASTRSLSRSIVRR
ncbi:hypothetical protein ABL78_4094 [Leptomonas seymouri]|uniref:Uncharacterized protein n=1 Tax=Leptomonas seymouri TaxID=5684 RepID=A0A0N0P669_LEPSE|nr:hypothetical protein ABL78_4094 [Leptomonas seymouri]|eukprot:KPI86817.1 hypothetical protein ABL78_4094 [Leptomonas seymouri]